MKYTPVKGKLTRVLGNHWTHRAIAQQAGVQRSAVTMEVNCTEEPDCSARHNPAVQEAIAKAVDISVGKLFGQHAWFRIAGKQLVARAKAKRRNVA